MAKTKVVDLLPNGEPPIAAPPEQVSDKPAVEIVPAPADERPSNHFGEWPTAVGQRVRGETFPGDATVVRIIGETVIVLADEDGQEYVTAVSTTGVIAE